MDKRFIEPLSLGEGTGRKPLEGEPKPGDSDFEERFCALHGIKLTEAPPAADQSAGS